MFVLPTSSCSVLTTQSFSKAQSVPIVSSKKQAIINLSNCTLILYLPPFQCVRNQTIQFSVKNKENRENLQFLFSNSKTLHINLPYDVRSLCPQVFWGFFVCVFNGAISMMTRIRIMSWSLETIKTALNSVIGLRYLPIETAPLPSAYQLTLHPWGLISESKEYFFSVLLMCTYHKLLRTFPE